MRGKKVVFFGVLFFLIGHFALTFMYCLPSHLTGEKLSSYSRYYSYPLFQQGWALFAPEPQLYHKTLKCRVYRKGHWSGWHIPADHYYQGHVSNRLGPSSELYFIAQQSALYLWIDMDKCDESHDSPQHYYPGTYGYQQANHFGYNWIKQYSYHREHDVDSVQVMLVLEKSLSDERIQSVFPACTPSDIYAYSQRAK